MDRRPSYHPSTCYFALVLLTLAVTAERLPGEVVEIAYTFSNDDRGGIGLARVDNETGKLLRPTVMLESKQCRLPVKVRRSPLDRDILCATNTEQDGPHLFLIKAGQPFPITLASAPDELRFAGQQIVATCEEDELAVVDVTTARLERLIKLSELLDPPGAKPEDVRITDDMKFAVVSFQKDSKSGRKKGSRIAIFKLPQLDLVSDIPLPRSLPELHFEDNKKQQGPSPEIVHVFGSADTVLVTLDLYGAIGTFDWNAAREGRLENWNMISSDATGKWGVGFPDRATRFRERDSEYVLVCNAGLGGGAFVFDVQQQTVIWNRPTPPGLEAPVFWNDDHRFAYSVCAGKTKQRGDDDVVKTFHPRQLLFIFDLRATEGSAAPTTTLDLGIYTTQIRVVAGPKPLLLIVGGVREDEPDTLMTVDPIARKVIDQYTTSQILVRLER